jgi:hypothetical protein
MHDLHDNNTPGLQLQITGLNPLVIRLLGELLPDDQHHPLRAHVPVDCRRQLLDPPRQRRRLLGEVLYFQTDVVN